MEVTEEKTPVKMLEKIAELEHSQTQMRSLNIEMRQWLEVADEELAALRSENASLKKQVKALEKIIAETQEEEAEPCSAVHGDGLDLKRCSDKKLEELENESNMLMERNKKLNEEFKNLEQERAQDKATLNELRAAIQTLERGIEEAQIGLQQRDDVIHQKTLQLMHSKEILDECSDIIKDLRLTNQELRKQLEHRQDEASLAILNDAMAETEGSFSSPLSIAEEIKLLVTSAKVSDFTDHRQEETEAEELLKLQPLTVDAQTERCAGVLETVVQGVRLFMLFVFTLTTLAIMATVSCAGNSGLYSINTLWSSASLMMQPYCRVYYETLPPI